MQELQDWMGTSVGGGNPVTLDLLVIFQVSIPPSGARACWLGSSLALILFSARSCCICSDLPVDSAGSYVGGLGTSVLCQ